MDKWLQLQDEFQQGEAFLSLHGLEQTIWGMAESEWEGLADHLKDPVGFKNDIYVIGNVWVGPGRPWYLYGFTAQPRENRKLKKKRRDILFRFCRVAAGAGARLLTSVRHNLPTEARDAVDAWLTWMWQQSPPTKQSWTDERKHLRIIWRQPFRVAAEVIEKSGFVGAAPPGEKSRRGRRRRNPDKLDKVLRTAIRRGDANLADGKWKAFLAEHAAELPKRTTPDQIRMRHNRLTNSPKANS